MRSIRNRFHCFYLFVAAASLLPHSAASAQTRPRTVAYQFSHVAIMDPTLSPDGKEMIYIMVIAGREQLMRRAVDGSYVRQLTSDDADHEDPAWSPDASRVAFVLIKNGLEQIQLMNPDGLGVEPLTPTAVKTIHPSWSPDSRRVLYCTDDDLAPPRKSPSEIYSIDIATRSITKLLSGGVNTYPVWSPDGKMMAFRRMLGETNSEVFVADADGSNPRNVTNNPAFDGWPAWSPDGSMIAFAELSDLYDASGWQRCATRCRYGRTWHSPEVVARWEDDLFHYMRQVRVQRRLSNLRGQARRVFGALEHRSVTPQGAF